MDGILIINKAAGMTSHDVVTHIRKLLKQRRVGHAGTLDPAARGVLPICVGQGTRIAEYLSESGKAYEAAITFGVVTDTYDAEGIVIRTKDATSLTRAELEAALPHFLGSQMQMPPRYSALKLGGQPAYKRVRAGEEITLEARPIEIQQLSILNWQPPCLTLAIECSKGTYIRSLAYDLGEYLGYGAHLSALTRTRSGPFTLADSLTLEQLATRYDNSELEHILLPPDRAMLDYPAILLDAATSMRVLHGNSFPNSFPSRYQDGSLARVYDNAGRFLAIASWNAQQMCWQPKKVFEA
jgi:tRNA pseudouridine55 synthase